MCRDGKMGNHSNTSGKFNLLTTNTNLFSQHILRKYSDVLVKSEYIEYEHE